MSINPTNNSTSAASSIVDQLGSRSENVKQSQLDKDAFLKLISAQLKYQDPMSPTDNKDFMSTMAQITSLEQITNLANATADQIFSGHMTSGVQMIGKNVSFLKEDGTPGNGVVESVQVLDGKVYLQIGDEKVPVNGVQEVK